MGVGERILARLAEVEAVAIEARDSQPYDLTQPGGVGAEGMRLVRQSSAVDTLRWVAALRAVVELHSPDTDDLCQMGNYAYAPCPTLVMIAAIWGDAGDGAGGGL